MQSLSLSDLSLAPKTTLELADPPGSPDRAYYDVLNQTLFVGDTDNRIVFQIHRNKLRYRGGPFDPPLAHHYVFAFPMDEKPGSLRLAPMSPLPQSPAEAIVDPAARRLYLSHRTSTLSVVAY